MHAPVLARPVTLRAIAFDVLLVGHLYLSIGCLAGHVEVSFVVHVEFSSVTIDGFGNVIEKLVAHHLREHPDVRPRPEEIGVA